MFGAMQYLIYLTWKQIKKGASTLLPKFPRINWKMNFLDKNIFINYTKTTRKKHSVKKAFSSSYFSPKMISNTN